MSKSGGEGEKKKGMEEGEKDAQNEIQINFPTRNDVFPKQA